MQLPLRVWTDSTATMGICRRQGLGKLRHINTQCLWIQQPVRDGTFELRKVKGTENPADLFTKYLTGNEKVVELLRMFGCEYMDGRPQSAPSLRAAVGTSKGELLAVEDSVQWDGRTFPRAEGEYRDLPDAYSRM